MSKQPCAPPTSEIIRVVCEEYNIKESDLKTKCRKWQMVDAKQTVCFLRMSFGEYCTTLADEYGFTHPAILHNKKTTIKKLTPIIPNTNHYHYKPFKSHFDRITKALGFQWELSESEKPITLKPIE